MIDDHITGILVASDQLLLRAGLRELLLGEPDLDVVGEALDENETIYLAGRLEPDIVLMVALNRGEVSIGVTRRQLLGHELAHVVQQREGRVNPTTEVAGMPVNDDPSLESEADRLGNRAAG